ncbi:MAG: deoxyribodipyrimidine photo-lyase [Alphaproteobacteria bacterium]|nr:deoxyribodipyrimidine photo-lyase [Alphaproteobacteria bacterium]MBP7759485.1 deoxyribodipyrimidine photo-lyase [Alphaproteobacteria bacterium]MBP7762825.1 deoxyribodipyrimidine photo-lyase [Alphaproteobacteria bacterium]MBP7904323.1 deoxyribodipyrimidine photo-lyase [Alphaproteobacteria bacterium]
MSGKTAILWFRQDLRLRDNPALIHAVRNNYNILPLFILDDSNPGQWKRGAASRWWLHKSLNCLNQSLENKMLFRSGNPLEILLELIETTKAAAIFWNRCYEPWRNARDKALKETLKTLNIDAQSFNASLLWEPWEVKKSDGTPYKVFTPYFRKGCLSLPDPKRPENAPTQIRVIEPRTKTKLDDLDLMPEIPWYSKMAQVWTPGEAGAQKRLEIFLESGLKDYKEGRNRPDREKFSRLSPHLHFGEISPRQVWHDARAAGIAQQLEADTDHFCSELGWREFSYSLLHYSDNLPEKPLQAKFSAFPWQNDPQNLEAWQKGRTGIPIVDAGMRQLWQTGWMHNRVRMITASLLIKNMRIDWREGERWFWDCLVDADLANNAASWQWVAGCGADAAPYFRIFNPVTQGKKFDPEGVYVRTYVPEISNLPNNHIHNPWQAPDNILTAANVTLGQTYPHPLVNLVASREKALEAFAAIK